MAQLKDRYETEVMPALRQKYGYKNRFQVPAVQVVVVNAGLGKAGQDKEFLDEAVNEFALITGQKPVITRARKSIASFNLRKGARIGCMVTLRRDRMYEFLERLINVTLPRIRDFRGVPPGSFDGRGNYTLGIKEQAIFPEINYDSIKNVYGMGITIVTTADADDPARELLRLLGMPFASGEGES